MRLQDFSESAKVGPATKAVAIEAFKNIPSVAGLISGAHKMTSSKAELEEVTNKSEEANKKGYSKATIPTQLGIPQHHHEDFLKFASILMGDEILNFAAETIPYAGMLFGAGLAGKDLFKAYSLDKQVKRFKTLSETEFKTPEYHAAMTSVALFLDVEKKLAVEGGASTAASNIMRAMPLTHGSIAIAGLKCVIALMHKASVLYEEMQNANKVLQIGPRERTIEHLADAPLLGAYIMAYDSPFGEVMNSSIGKFEKYTPLRSRHGPPPRPHLVLNPSSEKMIYSQFVDHAKRIAINGVFAMSNSEMVEASSSSESASGSGSRSGSGSGSDSSSW
jgi:hypothetical protein